MADEALQDESPEKVPPLSAEVAELSDATAAFFLANDAFRVASSAQTDALNRVNAAQRALDGAVADLQRSAPKSSDWGESRANKR